MSRRIPVRLVLLALAFAAAHRGEGTEDPQKLALDLRASSDFNHEGQGYNDQCVPMRAGLDRVALRYADDSPTGPVLRMQRGGVYIYVRSSSCP